MQTEYDDVCRTEYRSETKTEYESKCEVKYDSKCETKYETVYEEVCDEVKDDYGAPAAPVIDSYGSPSAAPIQPASLDQYGTPAAPPVSCRQVPSQQEKEECTQVPREECVQVPREVTVQVPEQVDLLHRNQELEEHFYNSIPLLRFVTKCQGKFPSRFVDKRKGKTAMISLGTFLERNVNR